MKQSNCPLCREPDISAFHQDKNRDYLRCKTCQLVFVPKDQHLTFDQEKNLYDLHKNHLHDQGYRQFLSRLSTPLLARLQPGSFGLDYGCGPGPLLAEMLSLAGHKLDLYDPFYANDNRYRHNRYDFVTCTEVIEHFRLPGLEFQHLFSLLKPNGRLGLMTKLVVDAEAFSKWHYIQDPTHISFFSIPTLRWLAACHQAAIDFIGKDVIIMSVSNTVSPNHFVKTR